MTASCATGDLLSVFLRVYISVLQAQFYGAGLPGGSLRDNVPARNPALRRKSCAATFGTGMAMDWVIWMELHGLESPLYNLIGNSFMSWLAAL